MMDAPTELFLSLIVPVYNRPQEVDELLESLSKQTNKQFEVILVEDGSKITCVNEVEKYKHALTIHYFFKPNSGPGTSRNYGSERANGNYFVFLDSDCVIPEAYVETVYNALRAKYSDAFGGPDRASENFTVLQKAINYAMTSFITTGGIRGGGEKMDKFHPRSFNMGYSKQVFETTKGFSKMRFGEDIDMSLRIINNGFTTALFKDAFVYHKRRTKFRQFFKQVFNSGIARIHLNKKHPGTLKLVHALPACFVLGTVLLLVLSIFVSAYFLLPLALLTLVLFVDALFKTKNVKVAAYAVVASYYQLIGYGTGFLTAFWRSVVFSKGEFSAFEKTFYD